MKELKYAKLLTLRSKVLTCCQSSITTDYGKLYEITTENGFQFYSTKELFGGSSVCIKILGEVRSID